MSCTTAIHSRSRDDHYFYVFNVRKKLGCLQLQDTRFFIVYAIFWENESCKLEITLWMNLLKPCVVA